MRAVAIHTSDRADITLTHACLLQIVSERVYLVCNVDNPRKPLVSPLAERAALIDARIADSTVIFRHTTRPGQALHWRGREQVCDEIVASVAAEKTGWSVVAVQLIGQDSFEEPGAQHAFSDAATRRTMQSRSLLVFPRSTAEPNGTATVRVPVVLSQGGVTVEVAAEYRDPYSQLSSTRLRKALALASNSAGDPGAADAPPEGVHEAVWRRAAERRTYAPLPTAPTALHVAILGAPGCGKSTLCTNLTSRLAGLRHLSGGDFHRAAVEALGARYAEGKPLARMRRDDLYEDELSRFIYSCHSVACTLLLQAGPCRAVVTDAKSPAALCILEARHLSALEARETAGQGTRRPTPPTPRAFDLVVVVECSEGTLRTRLKGRAARAGDWYGEERRLQNYLGDAGVRRDQLASYESARGATHVMRLDGEMDADAMCTAVEAEARRAAAAKPAVELAPAAAAIGCAEEAAAKEAAAPGAPSPTWAAVRAAAASAVAGARRRAFCRQVVGAAWEKGGFDRVMDEAVRLGGGGKGGGSKSGGGKGGGGKGGGAKGSGGKGGGGKGRGGTDGEAGGGRWARGSNSERGQSAGGKGSSGGPPPVQPPLVPQDSDGCSWHGRVSEPGTPVGGGGGKGGGSGAWKGEGSGRGGGKGESRGHGKGSGGDAGRGRDGRKGTGRSQAGGKGRAEEAASASWRRAA